MSWYEDKEVLITGGAGFIGSHLAERLLGLGARVTIIDNLSTGSLENIASCREHHTFSYIEGSITDKALVAHIMKNKEVVFHCAAFVSVAASMSDPRGCLTTNVEGTRILLDAAARERIRSFVFSSSAAVYGSKEAPCTEADPYNPKSPYAHSKVEGEQLCAFYARTHGLNTIILRYFNVYGRRQNTRNGYTAVVAAFTKNLQEARPLTIFGTGLQTRDFVSVDRVVEANLIMGMQQSLYGEIFNIASGRSISLFELIGQLASSMRPEQISLTFAPAREGDIISSQADCSKYEQFTSSLDNFTLEFINPRRSGETGRHARFRV